MLERPYFVRRSRPLFRRAAAERKLDHARADARADHCARLRLSRAGRRAAAAATSWRLIAMTAALMIGGAIVLDLLAGFIISRVFGPELRRRDRDLPLGRVAVGAGRHRGDRQSVVLKYQAKFVLLAKWLLALAVAFVVNLLAIPRLWRSYGALVGLAAGYLAAASVNLLLHSFQVAPMTNASATAQTTLDDVAVLIPALQRPSRRGAHARVVLRERAGARADRRRRQHAADRRAVDRRTSKSKSCACRATAGSNARCRRASTPSRTRRSLRGAHRRGRPRRAPQRLAKQRAYMEAHPRVAGARHVDAGRHAARARRSSMLTPPAEPAAIRRVRFFARASRILR